MLAEIEALPAEQVALTQAIGRVLAHPVSALRDQPPFAASAMDGWAVRSADTPGELKIVGESAAGHGYAGRVGPHEAVRIFTGAALPQDTDAIVIQEDAQHDGDRVRVPAAVSGANVRPAGGDFRAADLLLRAGDRIDPWRLTLAAAAGRAQVSVHASPTVAILGTGEEIVEAPATPGPFQIYDSGAPTLVALVSAWGGRATKSKPVADNLEAVIAALRDARADLVVTVGGASVGDHDLVRAAAEALGFQPRVQSVAVRPGKPTFFGVLPDGRKLLGLPGNPASALVCAELFLRPILSAFQGAAPQPRIIQARLSRPLKGNGPREHWMRARLSFVDGAVLAEPMADQDSSLVTVFASADALLRREAGAPAAAEGAVVDVLPLARA